MSGLHDTQPEKWVKSGKDYHRAQDEMSRFVDGYVDQLNRMYALQAKDPTPAGFFDCFKSVKDNLSQLLAPHGDQLFSFFNGRLPRKAEQQHQHFPFLSPFAVNSSARKNQREVSAV